MIRLFRTMPSRTEPQINRAAADLEFDLAGGDLHGPCIRGGSIS